MNRMLMICLSGLALCFVAGTTRGQTDTPGKKPDPTDVPSPKQQVPSAGESAIQRAADANNYIFVFFFRSDDEATQASRTQFDTVMPKFADRAISTTVNIGDSHEKALVKKYELDRAPMPLLLALAPNGAVTRSFPLKFTETQLETAFVSPGMQKCLKALQDRKMVFICIQNKTTRQNDGALKGVNEFVADKEFSGTTQIVTIDPTDEKEQSLLKQFKVDPTTEVAETVLLAPPGTVVGNFVGITSKDVMVAAVKSAAKGCDPKSGCCAPPKKS